MGLDHALYPASAVTVLTLMFGRTNPLLSVITLGINPPICALLKQLMIWMELSICYLFIGFHWSIALQKS